LNAGTWVAGLEPSCVSVFRDELVNLMHGNADAQRLSKQTFLLSEFLVEKAPNFQPPSLSRDVLVHGHCHQKAVLRVDDEEKLISHLGVRCRVLDSGCCGMAGAFGFEKGEHYDVSIACGERVLLPAVRSASADTLIIANGFSCREQIEQTTGRTTLHPAQLVKMALDAAPSQHTHA
jgi:Fe-S oxidoreductase